MSNAELLEAAFGLYVEEPEIPLGYYVLETGKVGLSHRAVDTLRQFYQPSDSFALVIAKRTMRGGVQPSLRESDETSCVLASAKLVERWAALQRSNESKQP